MNGVRILYYDIEVSPLIGTSWATYDTNLIWIIKEWYMLSFAWSWGDEKAIHVLGLPDFKLYKKEPENDRELVRELHKLFDEADIVVAHNGDRFDQKKTNARIIFNGMKPPSPYRSIDTLKVAKSKFAFTSNKLNDLGVFLGCGQKLDTDASLWKKCMLGDEKAWKYMLKYNKQDVVLLKEVHEKLKPWIDSPHRTDNSITACPKCGGGPMHNKGFQVSKTAKYQRYQCQSCGGYSRSRVAEKGPKPIYV